MNPQAWLLLVMTAILLGFVATLVGCGDHNDPADLTPAPPSSLLLGR